MIFWVLAGLITALATMALVAPLERQNRKMALFLTFAMPLLALILYILHGAPDFLK